VDLGLALVRGAPLPRLAALAAAAAVGFFGYRVSRVLLCRALGTWEPRADAYFSTAPFIAASLAVPLFGQRPIFTFESLVGFDEF
jgi:hypothetical protein